MKWVSVQCLYSKEKDYRRGDGQRFKQGVDRGFKTLVLGNKHN